MSRTSGSTIVQSTFLPIQAPFRTMSMAASRTFFASSAIGEVALSGGPTSRRRPRAVTVPAPWRITPNATVVVDAGTGKETVNGVHSASPRTARSRPLSSISMSPGPRSRRIHSEAPPAPRVCNSARNVSRRPRSVSAGRRAETFDDAVAAAAGAPGTGSPRTMVMVAPDGSVASPVAVPVYPDAAAG